MYAATARTDWCGSSTSADGTLLVEGLKKIADDAKSWNADGGDGVPVRPMTHDELNEFRKRLMASCSPSLALATVPIIGIQNELPVPNGSGVLLGIGECHFLVSAAHVLDVATIHGFTYCLPGAPGESPVHLNRVRVFTSPPPEGYALTDPELRDNDRLDVGVCELTPEIVRQLDPARRFVRLYEVESSVPSPQGIHLLMGYPGQLAVHSDNGNRVLSEPLRCMTELYTGERDDRDQEAHILVNYLTEGVDEAGSTLASPKPHGLSGCGIWRLADPTKPAQLWTPSDVRLVGIQHRWRSRKRYAVGTSISAALALIYEHVPDVRPSMNLHYPRTAIRWQV